jgi:uncharacterized protein YdaU (DUF1376 family)
MNYYSFHIADWALHTSHLTLEEDAVYRRLLDHYYDSEQPIPKETQPVIRRLRLVSHAETVALILAEFFTLEADGWHNHRADCEIANYRSKAETAKANGAKGGRPRANKGLETQPVISANPAETGSQANQEPITINQQPIEQPSAATATTTKAKALRGTRLPADWTLPQDWADWAASDRAEFTRADIARTADSFADYYHAATRNGTKLDWLATWRNWFRNQKAPASNVRTFPQRATGPDFNSGDTSWASDLGAL